jgi:hypothetical protein
MPDGLEARTWFKSNDTHEVDVRLFLVRAPLTFGHSQLVMKYQPRTRSKESTRFRHSAGLIERALSSFKQVLTADTIKKFKNYAEITLTKGSYIKTLILRASADEKSYEYKVHLVPYFKSHARACQKRYTAIHSVDPKDKGGLLGWLGDRETIVDNWQIKTDNPFDSDLDRIADDHWKLPKLAKLLSRAWQSQA